MFNIQEFIDSAKRILIVSKKPDLNEYLMIAKVTALGIVVIAIIGFIVILIFSLLKV